MLYDSSLRYLKSLKKILNLDNNIDLYDFDIHKWAE